MALGFARGMSHHRFAVEGPDRGPGSALSTGCTSPGLPRGLRNGRASFG